jgi:hypothetical protein
VVPGTYRARLELGGEVRTVSFEVRADPRSPSTAQERQAQLAFLLEGRDKLTEVHRAIRRLRAVRAGLRALQKRAREVRDPAPLRAAAKRLENDLAAVEKALYQTKSKSPQDPLNFPIRLDDKLAGLLGLVATGDHAPTAQDLAVRDELVAAIDDQLSTLTRVLDEHLPALNQQAAEAGVPAVASEAPGGETAESGK